MYHKVIKYIDENRMLDGTDAVVAGLSGGADSVALVSILEKVCKERGIKLIAVHVHHGIRGAEADEDLKFCRKLCKTLGIVLREYRFNVPEYAKQNKLSCEEAGRLLRYESFRKTASEYEKSRIAVAHHMNDQAETVIFNAARGSGIRGLRGMLPVKDDVIRPLLCCTREEIEEYDKEEKLVYRTDSTNDDDDYSRNVIRHRTIPSLVSINACAVKNIAGAAARCMEAEEYLEAETERLYRELAEERPGTISLAIDKSTHPYMAKRLIRKSVGTLSGLKDVTSVQVDAVFELITMCCGKKTDITGGLRAERTSDGIIFYIKHKKREIIIRMNVPSYTDLPYEKGIVKAEIEKWSDDKKILNEVYTKQFDYDKIKDSLCLRTRQDGDYLVIDACGRTKKLNRYFTDERVPAALRDDILLLADGRCIMWVIGMRMGENYKISTSTENVLKVTYGGNTNGKN